MKRMINATIALTLLGSTAAFAQAGSYRSGPQEIELQNRNSADPRDQNTIADDQGRSDQANRGNEVRDNPHWSRGDRLPTEYRSNQYVVSDWKSNHLKKPPRGYHWVRANDRYVLTAVVSGVIADIIMNDGRAR